MPLPIEPLRGPVLEAIERSNVVVSAPTASGKSTQVPRWLTQRGRVLVVEPRRVACRALAARVAELEGSPLGQRVGYVVRHDRRARADTAVLFVTPGVALRMLRAGDDGAFATLVLDEFHERGLDTDLLLALALQRDRRVLAMSATVEGDRLAEHLGGPHLAGEGRQHPVTIEHHPGDALLPSPDGLEQRIRAAVTRLLAETPTGDVLVFLPGVGEIRDAEASLRGLPAELVPLHGRLSLDQQARALRAADQRRVYLATNVAETSLTLPGVVAVVDSGLVRRTRYHGGRAYLGLGPVALDSADQRAGRAGRLGPGRCVRLWSPRASLDPHTPPAIHRESLVPLLLASAACGHPALDLPWVDPPTDYAADAARADLERLGALDSTGVTPLGERLFTLPTDAWMARLLVECAERGLAEEGVALAASLSTRRRLFARPPEDPDDDLCAAGCDALAGMRAVWEGRPRQHGLDGAALDAARAAAKRFRALLGVEPPSAPPSVDRRALALAVLAAWPDAAHVARRRKRHVAWGNGQGPELALGRDSAVREDDVEAVLVLDRRAFGRGADRTLLITAAMPVPPSWLVAAGLGEDRLAGVHRVRGRVLARTERVYAGRVLETDEVPPKGAMARDAVAELILRGTLRKGLVAKLAERIERRSLAAALADEPPLPPPEEWLRQQLAAAGLEDPKELSLLEDEDLLPEALPAWEREQLDAAFPRDLAIGDATYTLTYDVPRRTARLVQVGGTRKTPPPDRFLPKAGGFKLELERKNRVTTLRGR